MDPCPSGCARSRGGQSSLRFFKRKDLGMSLRTSLAVILSIACAAAQPASELRFCLRTDPKTFDPLLATEEASETVRYLTGGVLIRFNRRTQQLEPGLAESWRVQDGGRRIDFVLRKGVLFSDGTPCSDPSWLPTIRPANTFYCDVIPTTGEPIPAAINFLTSIRSGWISRQT